MNMNILQALLAANAQCSAEPAPWIRARGTLRRKNNTESILPSLRALKHALSDEPNGKVEHKQLIDELRTTINAVVLFDKCKTVNELDGAFALFVDRVQHFDMNSRPTKAAVKKAYAVYGTRKAFLVRQRMQEAQAKPAAESTEPAAKPVKTD
jgi:hypothetical protein